MKYKVSVCIPIYNAGKYLRKCLDSLINQTLKEIQIVCVNDGSTDDSLTILKEYSKKYSNIKVISQNNKGVIEARIKCFNNADAEYIGWVDADDFVEVTMFEKMYNAAKKEDSDVVICNYNFYPQRVINKSKWFREYKGKVDWEFISFNTIQWNKIVKRSLLERLEIADLFKNIGEGCYSIVLINANGVSTINECLYNYRVGHESLSSNFKNIDWYKKTIHRAKIKEEYIDKHNYDDYWKEFFHFVYLYYCLIHLIVSAYSENYEEYKSSKKILKKEKMFSKKNLYYLKNYFSYMKIIYLKYIGINSYLLLKLSTKILFKTK